MKCPPRPRAANSRIVRAGHGTLASRARVALPRRRSTDTGMQLPLMTVMPTLRTGSCRSRQRVSRTRVVNDMILALWLAVLAAPVSASAAAVAPACDLTGHWSGGLGAAAGQPLILVEQHGASFTASAPGYWDNTTTGGIAVGTISGDTITGKGGWTHDTTTVWSLKIGSLGPGGPPCSELTTTANGQAVAGDWCLVSPRCHWCLHSRAPATCGAPAAPKPPPFDGCVNQAANGKVTAAQFGEIYAVNDAVGVHFTSSDPVLQKIYEHAIECENNNSRQFLPGLYNVVEGYHCAYPSAR